MGLRKPGSGTGHPGQGPRQAAARRIRQARRHCGKKDDNGGKKDDNGGKKDDKDGQTEENKGEDNDKGTKNNRPDDENVEKKTKTNDVDTNLEVNTVGESEPIVPQPQGVTIVDGVAIVPAAVNGTVLVAVPEILPPVPVAQESSNLAVPPNAPVAESIAEVAEQSPGALTGALTARWRAPRPSLACSPRPCFFSDFDPLRLS